MVRLLFTPDLGHFNLIAPKVSPSDIPPLPTAIGHGQVAEWLAKPALQLAKELVAAQGGQLNNQGK
jgi:hypothetical protein